MSPAATATAATGTDQPKYQRIGEFFTLLSRGLKTSLLYPPDNPIPKEFKRAGWDKLNAFLIEFGDIAIDVHPNCFKDRQAVVYKAGETEENLPGLLHRDGIRRLTLKEGLQASEWEGLFDSILSVMKNREGFEDIVNLFWQRDFVHIEYDAVDDFAVAEFGSEGGERHRYEEVEFSDLVSAESQIKTENPLELLNPERAAEAGAPTAPVHELLQLDHIFKRLSTFSDEEQEYVENQVAADEELVLEFEAIDLLMDILVSETDTHHFEESLDALVALFDRLLEAEQLFLAIYVLQKIKEGIHKLQQTYNVRAEKLMECLSRAGDRIRISKLTNLLNRSEDQDVSTFRAYLEELEWESSSALIWMLGELSHYSARKMVIQLLVEKGSKRLDIIGNAVYDPRWYVVRNAVLILGEIGDPKGLSYLKKPLEHEDERVRWEALIAAERISGEKGSELLMTRLLDESERIRRKALSVLAARRFQPALEWLSRIVQGADLREFSIDEQKEFMQALALVGGDQALPLLKRIIKKLSLFQSEQDQKSREYAVMALSKIDSAAAADLLKELAGKRGKLGTIAKLLLEKRAVGSSETTDAGAH